MGKAVSLTHMLETHSKPILNDCSNTVITNNKVQERMQANQTLEVNDFHFQWRLNRLEKLPPSFLNDDPVTATSPLPDILLRDPQEDPVPPISEDLTSI